MALSEVMNLRSARKDGRNVCYRSGFLNGLNARCKQISLKPINRIGWLDSGAPVEYLRPHTDNDLT